MRDENVDMVALLEDDDKLQRAVQNAPPFQEWTKGIDPDGTYFQQWWIYNHALHGAPNQPQLLGGQRIYKLYISQRLASMATAAVRV